MRWRQGDDLLASEAPPPIVEPLRIDPLARREGAERQPRLVHRGQRGTSICNRPAATCEGTSRESTVSTFADSRSRSQDRTSGRGAAVYAPIVDGLRIVGHAS